MPSPTCVICGVGDACSPNHCYNCNLPFWRWWEGLTDLKIYEVDLDRPSWVLSDLANLHLQTVKSRMMNRRLASLLHEHVWHEIEINGRKSQKRNEIKLDNRAELGRISYFLLQNFHGSRTLENKSKFPFLSFKPNTPRPRNDFEMWKFCLGIDSEFTHIWTWLSF